MTAATAGNHRRERRLALIGVALVAAAFVCASAFAAFSLRWSGTADAYEHLDYTLQVARGGLPAPIGHVFDPAVWTITESRLELGRQYASAHPPLFYLLSAGLVGGLLEAASDDQMAWIRAVAELRLLNIGLGVVALLGMAWGGWTIGGRLRAPLAIAIPAVGAFTYAYLRFSGEVYGDMLLVVASTWTVAVAAAVLLRGPSAWRIVALCGLAIVGAGSKATFVLVLAIASAAILGGVLLHGRGGTGRRVLLGLGAAALPWVAAVAAFGWFYVRNALLSGSWYRSVESGPLQGRLPRTLWDNLADWNFYGIYPGGLFGKWAVTVFEWAPAASAIVFWAASLATLLAWGLRIARGRTRPSVAQWGVVAMLVALMAGAYLMQLSHAIGYGTYNTRYFLPATFAFAALMVGGIVLAPRLRAFLLPSLQVVLIVGSAVSLTAYAAGAERLLSDPVGAMRDLGPIFVPSTALVVLLVAAVAFAASTAIPLWMLRDRVLAPDAAEPSDAVSAR
ncbi:hypothetical protein ARHIZOSPH14_03360 [Agromyces rhizosphaerae]|uniref:Uncharacterized protein n=1 Tax=Agromyces rhizosphaerae TaxID=88374 RepID=A0A9W6CVI3_9MICO|nr:hypothetical protein [Agromyces rhizosphaerae]GLI26094.1 hypothetical protein ARHIZOSPH14_03360 [Agromyces rhizosphaerae]